MPRASMSIAEAGSLPRWRRPEALLMPMASPLAFATWMALLNNFVVEKVAFDGFDIGVLHVAREIPGFLAFLVIYLLFILREQTLAFAALILLGLFTGLTSNFPSFCGLMLTTTLSSIGFHYYETIQQSLQLQWLPRERAPQGIGWIVSAGSFGSLVVFGLITLFLVDALNLFYISLLGHRELAAAIGFAGTVQFFMISMAIGLSIAATAVVSRAVGAGDTAGAHRLDASSLTLLVAVLGAAAALAWLGRGHALDLLGATGETRAIASRFLAIILP